jgi:hypothetical protein
MNQAALALPLKLEADRQARSAYYLVGAGSTAIALDTCPQMLC